MQNETQTATKAKRLDFDLYFDCMNFSRDLPFSQKEKVLKELTVYKLLFDVKESIKGGDEILDEVEGCLKKFAETGKLPKRKLQVA